MSEFAYQFLLTLDSSLRLAAPLIFCAMAGIFSERSGIIDISLEGKMLMAAFVAATVAYLSGSAWLAVFTAIGASVCLALVHGFACITHKGNQVVSGLAINLLAAGISVTVAIALFRQGGQTPPLTTTNRFRPIEWWFVDWVDAVPILGPIYRQLISGHNILVYLALLSVVITYVIITKTRFGLRLRAVGDVPDSADSAGISVNLVRYQAVILAGIFCGLAGAYLSIAQGAGFVRDMSAGKGFIALAAVIFGKWRPISAFLACMMFGFLEAGATRLQGVDLPLIGEAPSQLILALPYIMTVLLLAGFIGKANPPAAIGIPYHK